MKHLLATTLLTFGFSAFTMASESIVTEPTKCQVFSLKADKKYVKKNISTALVQRLVDEGKEFGLQVISVKANRKTIAYSLNYALKFEDQIKDFNNLILSFQRHVTSQIAYSFSCELETPTPLPVITGSTN